MAIKDFTLVDKLGEGAYAEVYKVRRNSDGHQYAMKKVKLNYLCQKQLQNAVNEVRILASIKSPFIIGYKDAFLDGKSLHIVMEFADDGDLYKKIASNKQKKQYLEESFIWKILIHITKALFTLHEMKICHRDLKSANIFLTKNGCTKLGDMNVSKIAKNGLMYTQTGTPYYASPQVWMQLPYDSKSDIWSFGVVLYEMAALNVPFLGNDMKHLCKAIVEGKMQPLPNHYSIELISVIKMMLSSKPNNRPSASRLLNSSLIIKKAAQLGINLNEQSNSYELLKTIKVPKNLYYLTSRLPDANYDGSKSQPKPNKFRQSKQCSNKGTLVKLQKVMGIEEIGKTKERIQSIDRKDQLMNHLYKENAYEGNSIIKKAYERRYHQGQNYVLPPIKI